MAKILIHTLGSSGDFNPFMALALELRRRGHSIHWAVSPKFADKARAQGFEATVAGVDPEWESDMLRRMLAAHLTDPVQILFKEVLIPRHRPSHPGPGAAGARGRPVPLAYHPARRSRRGRPDRDTLDQRQRGNFDP